MLVVGAAQRVDRAVRIAAKEHLARLACDDAEDCPTFGVDANAVPEVEPGRLVAAHAARLARVQSALGTGGVVRRAVLLREVDDTVATTARLC